MIYYAVSWSIGAGSETDGGNKTNAQFSDVHEKLLGAKEKSGAVTAELMGAPEIGPQRLHVEAENGAYVLSLGEDTGSEYHVRTFTNTNPSDEKNIVLGNSWDSRLVCNDFSIVVEAFTFFCETGDVPRKLLA